MADHKFDYVGKWLDGKYGSHYFYPTNNRDLPIVICWDSTQPKGSPDRVSGFKVSFAGVSLLARPTDLAQAKVLGIKLARKVLTEAIAGLPAE